MNTATATLTDLDGFSLIESKGMTLDVTDMERAALDALAGDYLASCRSHYNDTAELDWYLRSQLVSDVAPALRGAVARFDIADLSTFAMHRVYGI